ncbi:enoyl-CoA hydratase [Paracoccus suum]|uniref:Enoyl-CoA hydratase n=1 Tax=Paracoccus suum TaxID=2259340 RepID=A0A344PGS5_9RHOB|nr:enoyl-CoA hydratase family protein [Paracoccus suum]AXC48580.1 enoyl-CoA hydratase [Paracoccus suum]
MSDATCEIRDEGDRLVVTNINPARRNALSQGFYDGLTEALRTAASSPRIGAVVITGAEGFFCAGGDLGFLVQAQDMVLAERRARIDALHHVIRAIHACPRPVIAAVEGGAAGAGLSLALACDLVVAARDARFTAAYVNAGLVPDGGLTAALSAALPPQLVAEICLMGRPVSAERLFAAGAINLLTEPGSALAEAELMASQLATGPAAAQAAIKGLIGSAQASLRATQFEAEADAMGAALGQPEAAEGIAAFLGKRSPDFARLRR